MIPAAAPSSEPNRAGPLPAASAPYRPGRVQLLVRGAAEGARTAFWTTVFGVRFLLGRRRHADRQRYLAQVLRGYLLRMGPLYIKAGQVLATQSGLLSKSATDEFRSFFSDLPAMRAADLRRTLAANFSGRVADTFTSFDFQPLAVGSVAQVHRATMRDGTRVAVKIVKRGVRERLHVSAMVLHTLLSTAQTLVPRLRAYELPAHFAQMRPLLTGQTDLLREAAVQLEIADNFRSYPALRIPRPLAAVCTEDILVMEFLEGVRGQDVDQVSFPRNLLARRLQDGFYAMSYFHGLFHVDPHPGNIMFGDDGQILLLDFGLVGRLTEDDKWNLASFYYACVRREWKLGVERFTRAFVVGAHDLAADAGYVDELVGILRTHFESETTRWSTMAFFDDATRLLRRHGARVTTSFSLLALAFLTGEGFVCQVDPDIDIWANARRFTDRFSPYMSEEIQAQFERELGGRIPRSMRARQRVARHLVAPTHLDRFVLPSAFPLIVEDAQGARIRDIDGNSYIDLSCGYGPHILGYAPAVAVQAISAAAARGGVNALGNPAEFRLAEQISAAFPGTSVVFSNSGTEAVMMALRIARAYTGRDGVAKFEGHYHGFSDQGMVSSWFRFRGDGQAPVPIENSAGVQRSVVTDTLVLQYGERASLTRLAAAADQLACVIIEPMPSALGDYDREFLADLREVCTRHGILLIFDEVVTGFRVTWGGVQQLVGVTPDLTCLGKIIGGGLPCGAVAGRPDVVDVARTTSDPFLDVETRAFVGGTMSGNSITAAAGLAVVEHLRHHPEIYAGLAHKTAWLTAELTAHAASRGIACRVRGAHSIFSITFDYAMPRLVRDRLSGTNMKANIALAYYLRGHGVYMPELHTMMLGDAHSDADLRQVSAAFGASLDEMADNGFFAA